MTAAQQVSLEVRAEIALQALLDELANEPHGHGIVVALLRGIVAAIEEASDEEFVITPSIHCRDCNEFTPIATPKVCAIHQAKRVLAALGEDIR